MRVERFGIKKSLTGYVDIIGLLAFGQDFEGIESGTWDPSPGKKLEIIC